MKSIMELNNELKAMLPKAKALKKAESPRDIQIRENNEKAASWGIKHKALERHKRRHEGKPGTSREERSKWMNSMSKDS